MKTVFGLGAMAIAIALMVGWVMNVAAIFRLDFASPYKAEVIRIVGVFIAPVGSIAGYVTFNEEAK